MLQVRGAVFICGIQQLFRLCRRDTVALLHPLQSDVRGCANEEIQQIFVSLQNTVRAPAHDGVRALQLLDRPDLSRIDLVIQWHNPAPGACLIQSGEKPILPVLRPFKEIRGDAEKGMLSLSTDSAPICRTPLPN